MASRKDNTTRSFFHNYCHFNRGGSAQSYIQHIKSCRLQGSHNQVSHNFSGNSSVTTNYNFFSSSLGIYPSCIGSSETNYVGGSKSCSLFTSNGTSDS